MYTPQAKGVVPRAPTLVAASEHDAEVRGGGDDRERDHQPDDERDVGYGEDHDDRHHHSDGGEVRVRDRPLFRGRLGRSVGRRFISVLRVTGAPFIVGVGRVHNRQRSPHIAAGGAATTTSPLSSSGIQSVSSWTSTS